jgi:hypothetical protein
MKEELHRIKRSIKREGMSGKAVCNKTRTILSHVMQLLVEVPVEIYKSIIKLVYSAPCR